MGLHYSLLNAAAAIPICLQQINNSVNTCFPLATERNVVVLTGASLLGKSNLLPQNMVLFFSLPPLLCEESQWGTLNSCPSGVCPVNKVSCSKHVWFHSVFKSVTFPGLYFFKFYNQISHLDPDLQVLGLKIWVGRGLCSLRLSWAPLCGPSSVVLMKAPGSVLSAMQFATVLSKSLLFAKCHLPARPCLQDLWISWFFLPAHYLLLSWLPSCISLSFHIPTGPHKSPCFNMSSLSPFRVMGV